MVVRIRWQPMLKRGLRWLTALLASVPLTWALAVGVLGVLPVNGAFRSVPGGTEIFLRSNGVHTDIVLPMTTTAHHWARDLALPPGPAQAAYISFGWGDRGFYLETPTWQDLKISTAVTAVMARGRAVIHVEFPGGPDARQGDVIVAISAADYAKLVAFVRRSFVRDGQDRVVQIPGARYTPFDAFYEARGAYSLRRTCNEWVREALAHSGIRAPRWAPLDWALFYQLRRVEQ